MTMTLARPAAPERPAVLPGRPAPPGRPIRGSAERAAVLTLTAAIVFQPILHPAGPGNSSPVDVLTIASIAAAAIWAAGSHRKLRAPYALPVLLLIAAGAASGLASLLPSTALITLVIDVVLLGWCLTVVNVLSAPRALRCALAAWSWSGIFWAAVLIIAWAGHITVLEGLTPAEGNRVMFTFGDPNYASWYWVSTIFVVYASRIPAARWQRLTGYGLLLWAMVLSESNGGAIALCVGVTFLVLLRCYRRKGWPGMLAAALAVGLAVGLFLTALPLNELRQLTATSSQPLLVNSIGRSGQSGSERTSLITETIELYQGTHGLLGIGPAATKPLLAQWLYPYSNEAHNDWLAALAERGVVGLLALLLLAASAAARAGPVIRRPLSAPFAAAVPRPAGIVAALLAIGSDSFYEEVLHFRVLWLLLGIVAVLGHDARRQRAAHDRRRRLRAIAATRAGVLARATAATRARLLARPGGPQPQWFPDGPGSRSLGAALPAVSRHAVSNLAAQGGALAAVSLASLMVARVGGPAVLGEYALLRVLPWLLGLIISCGLPTAAAFFLAGPHGQDPRLRPTLAVMAVAGAGGGALVWLACAVPFRALFFRQLPVPLLLLSAALVVTWLLDVTAKACCQGGGDIAGANLIIVAEELWFVPTYPVVLLTFGYHKITSVIIAMIISGALASATGVIRLQRRGFFTGWGRPSAGLAKKIAAFGGRGQLGNMLWLANLRFDLVLLGALAGPTVVGIYSVASKFAELLRLVPTAINYVLYPRFARLGRAQAIGDFRRLLPRSTALTLALTPVVAVACWIGPPIVYGHAFRAAVTPAEIIVVGLSVEGAAAVASAFLLGRGRPGLNSVGMGAGTVITLTLDIILIPRYGALGGAVTSAVAYLTATAVLVCLAGRQARADTRASGRSGPPGPSRGPAGQADQAADADAARPAPRADSGLRRAVDVLVAGAALALASPLFLLAAAAVRLTSRGPALYRQVRVGRRSEPFTMLKFRSMVSDADRNGPLVTGRRDPRVTRVGAWLRATKLDEVPQLINVLRGDMTLVGPRPEVPRFIPCYREDELAILAVRPGLTGPGQIFYTEVQASQQAAADPEEHYTAVELHPKLAIDLDYLHRRGLRCDVAILVRTAGLLAGRGRSAGAVAATQGGSRP